MASKNPPTILVVGARNNSLGHRIKTKAHAMGYRVVTAGVSGEEDFRYDVRELPPHEVWSQGPYDSVICTVGVNDPDWSEEATFRINTMGPLQVLDDWVANQKLDLPINHYVAISSNSAHIARTGTLAYCMSKAALSMGIRVRARESAKAYAAACKAFIQAPPSIDIDFYSGLPAIYCYEPGYLTGTPMSLEVGRRLGGIWPHRIPSEQSLSPWDVATVIVNNLMVDGNLMNGSCIRLDGGEQ